MRAGRTLTRVEMMPAAALAAGRAAVKAHLRIESDAEDALIESYVAAAAGAFEAFAGLLAITREVTETLTADAGWRRLAAVPVLSIEAVESADGAAIAVEDRAIDIDPEGSGWVRVAGGGHVRVRYRAGLAEDWGALPEAARHGIVRLAAHLVTHRDRAEDAPPAAVAALWRPMRRMRLR